MVQSYVLRHLPCPQTSPVLCLPLPALDNPTDLIAQKAPFCHNITSCCLSQYLALSVSLKEHISLLTMLRDRRKEE